MPHWHPSIILHVTLTPLNNTTWHPNQVLQYHHITFHIDILHLSHYYTFDILTHWHPSPVITCHNNTTLLDILTHWHIDNPHLCLTSHNNVTLNIDILTPVHPGVTCHNTRTRRFHSLHNTFGTKRNHHQRKLWY